MPHTSTTILPATLLLGLLLALLACSPDDHADVVAALTPCGEACDIEMPSMRRTSVRIQRADPPILVFAYWHLTEWNYDKQLIFAAWGDGEIVWSEDTISGGAPYRRGRVPRSLLAQVVTEAASDQFLTHPAIDRYALLPNVRPPFASVTICTAVACLEEKNSVEVAASIHTVQVPTPGYPNRIVSVPLDGRDRQEVLAELPNYLEFRQIWTRSRQLILYTLIHAADDVELLPAP